MEIIGIFAWLGFCILVGKWNESRGNSFWYSFWLSFCCSPLLGALNVLLTKPDKKAAEENILSSGEMKKCPSCAELIKVEAKKCRYCGEEFGNKNTYSASSSKDRYIPSNEKKPK